MPVRVPSASFNLIRFDTADVAPRYRLDVWRDIVTRELLPLSMDPTGRLPFRAAVSMRAWGGVRIGSGIVGASINHRTREIVARDNDDLALVINSGGTLVVEFAGGDFILPLGCGTLISCEQMGRLSRPVAGKTICVRFPRSEMADLAPTFEVALGRIFPVGFGPMRLLKHYLDAVCAPDGGTVPPGTGRIVAQHACDMIALTVGASRDAAAVIAGRGLAASRLLAAKAFIDEHAGGGTITADRLARHLALPTRAVRKLFDGEGGVSGYVTRRRLVNARNMLESPRFAGTSIVAIAFDVGFGDLSYFNRSFRSRYNATPSEVRRAATSRAGPSNR